MRRTRLPLRMLLLAAGATAAGAGAWTPAARPLDDGVRRATAAARVTELVGVVHVHTTHSDGALDVADVAAAARSAGLDFVVVTDHNTFDGKPAEGYAGDLLLIVGTEISTDSGHVLGLGLDEPGYRFPRHPDDVLRDIADLGGVAIVAHPTSPKDGLRWRDGPRPGGWGVEVLNGDTQWRTAGPLSALYSLFVYPLRNDYALTRLLSRPAALRLWDEVLSLRRAAGIAGADVHTRVPSYESVFRVVRNHVLPDRPPTGDGPQDIAAIVDAIGRGRLFIGVDGIAPTDGFFYVAERGGRTWTMGDTAQPHPDLRLRAGGVRAERATFSLVRDGAVLATSAGALDAPASGSGVYRVEVTLPGWNVPWILSNPIYVFDEADRRRRAERLALPPRPPAPAPAAYVDRFDSGSVFTPASDPGSSITLATGLPAGDAHPAVARVAWRLGARTAATPGPYVALTNFASRDFSRYAGLTVTVKADGVRRLWVQVRDRNPRSFEGTEWWWDSLKATTEWQRLAVPFSRLRSRDPHTDGRLDLDEVEAVVLIVDVDSAPAGTAGTLWFDEVGLYGASDAPQRRP